eukprot:m.46532 g.46532  ORF g.46532 m.46532 type:complete len:476 (-) comp10929_c0_seq1:401-1828(-)
MASSSSSATLAVPERRMSRSESRLQLTDLSRLHMPTIIAKKRDNQELTPLEIEQFVAGFLRDAVSHEQIGALLMAIYLNGLNDAETIALTQNLLDSGDKMSWSHLGDDAAVVVDKHSTGGVGDKVSLPLAPALAACGCRVPMIAGRGLGHTGGTLDKLDSIPGYSFVQPPRQMEQTVQSAGCVIAGQSETLVPGDKVLYHIRDVTSTVESIPLITASIMSKKIAESPKALLLDVKVGSAAFMKTEERATTLAEKMCNVGAGLGIETTALLTQMDQPIGFMVGNALEVVESVECLQGKGPKDLEDLVCLEGGYLLASVNLASSPEEGIEKMRAVLHDGSALAKFGEMLQHQSVSKDVADKLLADPWSVVPVAENKTELVAQESGYVCSIEAMPVARVAGNLGAGRKRQTDILDLSAGVELKVAQGSKLEKGDVWAVVHHNKEFLDSEKELLQSALHITSEECVLESRLKKVVRATK